MATFVSIVLISSILFVLFYAGIPAKLDSTLPEEDGKRYFVALTPFSNHWKDIAFHWDYGKHEATLWLPRGACPVDSRWRKDTREGAQGTWIGPDGYFPAVIAFRWSYKYYNARLWQNGSKWEIDVQEDRVKNAPPRKLKNDDDDDFF